MRIISGEYKSRRLKSPPDDATRPIPDRVKESLYNLLRGHVEGVNVFDGFAGTGSIGLEALSRGAEFCTFVERDKAAAALLRENIETLGAGDRSDVVTGDALGPSALSRARRPLHLAFLDPPYPLWESAQGRDRIMRQGAALAAILDEGGFLVIRTPWPASTGPIEEQTEIDLRHEGLLGPETHEYGTTALHFYAPRR